MKPNRMCGCPAGQHGFTIVELLVAAFVATLVLLGVGSIYVSATRTMDVGSTLLYVQRQGTQIQEELARHIQRATALEVDNTQGLCGPTGPVTAGKSIIYQRTVGSPGSPSNPATHEFWCLYEFQGTGDAFPQLWRCQVSGLTPPQTCTSTPENLFASALRGFRGLGIGDSGTSFTLYTCPGCPTSLNVQFPLDVKRTSTEPSLIGGARWFGFNLTIRN
jgi:type II secretory pathway pseudopilin PulG